jgi:hypothetical protein
MSNQRQINAPRLRERPQWYNGESPSRMDLTVDIKDVVTVIALVAGPVIAVIITLWYQQRRQRYDAKKGVFLVLMANRRSNPPTLEWANALNLIDVVFADNRKVVDKWHDLFKLADQTAINWGQFGHTYIELLSEMAKVLGYRQLQQTDIDRFYAPQAHGTQAALNQELQNEFLRVLKATNTLRIDPKSADLHNGENLPFTTSKERQRQIENLPG